MRRLIRVHGDGDPTPLVCNLRARESLATQPPARALHLTVP